MCSKFFLFMDQSDNKYAKSIALLNDALRKEIATSLQYMYFHVRLEDAGYEYLAKYMFKVSISEMHHAEHIAERILFLGGDADMNPCDPTRQLTDVGDMLQLAVKLETSTVESYNAAAREAAAMGDTVTSRMFQGMAAEEEHHLDDFRTEMKNLQEYGELYLTMQSVGRSKERAKG